MNLQDLKAKFATEADDREKAAIEKWQSAPKAVPSPDQAIYLDKTGMFAFNYGEYAHHAIEESQDVAADRPYLCERRRPSAPNLAELIHDALEGDWCTSDGDFNLDLPDVSDLQAELDRRFEQASDSALGLWFATDVALDVTAIQEATRARWQEDGNEQA